MKKTVFFTILMMCLPLFVNAQHGVCDKSEDDMLEDVNSITSCSTEPEPAKKIKKVKKVKKKRRKKKPGKVFAHKKRRKKKSKKSKLYSKKVSKKKKRKSYHK